MKDITLWEEKNSTELPMKLENKPTYVQNDGINETKPEFVKKICESIGNKKIWKRNCPKCGCDIFNTTKWGRDDGVKNNRLCRSCSQYTDVAGKSFGYLTALNKVPSKEKYDYANALWLFRCICGKEVTKFIHSVKNKVGDSCGCRRGEKVHKRFRDYEWLYSKIKGRCKQKKFENVLSFEDFLSFTKITKCNYCHSPIVWIKHSSDCGKSPSNRGYHLDRKDNDVGYTKDNCVVCCNRCNFGKTHLFSYEEWYGMTEYLRKKTDA